MCVIVQKITAGLNDLWSRCLDCWFNLTLFRSGRRSRSEAKVNGHRMKNLFSAIARYEVTYFWLLVELFVLKSSMRPRVRLFSVQSYRFVATLSVVEELRSRRT